MTTPTPMETGKLRGTQMGKHRVDFEDNTVVFLIGMRVNSIWRIDQWLPVFLAMPKMLMELAKHRELGLLSYENWFGWRQTMVVQYWKDMDHLMRYATAPDNQHLPAWKAFNRRARKSSTVGIWHEAYEVHPQTSHIVYRDMPPSGMGAAARLMDIDRMPPQPVKRRGTGPDDSEYEVAS